MSKIAIVTDSNSGITQERGKELGIYVLPMPFFIDGNIYYEDITLTQEQFYEKLGADSDISTSQPSPGNVMELWEKILKDHDVSEKRRKGHTGGRCHRNSTEPETRTSDPGRKTGCICESTRLESC